MQYLESSVKEEWFGLVYSVPGKQRKEERFGLVYSVPGKQRKGRVVSTGLQCTWKAA
jgi:hypothetical protein